MESSRKLSIAWVLPLEGLIIVVLTALVLASLFSYVPGPRPLYYRLASVVGFCGWALYLHSRGSVSSSSALFFLLLPVPFLAVFLLPIEAGFLGWLGLTSWWRWVILAVGGLGAIAPLLMGFLLRLKR